MAPALTPTGTLFRFAATALLASAIVTLLVFVGVRQSAESAAVADAREVTLADAREVTLADARTVLTPLLTRRALGGDRAALGAIDAAVRGHVLSNRVVRAARVLRAHPARRRRLSNVDPAAGGLVFGADCRLLLPPHGTPAGLGRPAWRSGGPRRRGTESSPGAVGHTSPLPQDTQLDLKRVLSHQ